VRYLFKKTVVQCISHGLVSVQRLVADAGLIESDANKQKSMPKEDWNQSAIDPNEAPRAMQEYFNV
jgi:hypothetical protein